MIGDAVGSCPVGGSLDNLYVLGLSEGLAALDYGPLTPLYYEALGIGDTVIKHLHRALSESLTAGAGDNNIYSGAREINEGLGVTDSHSPARKKAFVDDFTYAEEVDKYLHKNITEALGLRDTMYRNANMVLFDLVFRSDALTPAEMDILADSPPVGYSPFQNFYPGDYNYRYGMYGIRVQGVDSGGQVGIEGLTLNVDVPDVTDRGDATVTSGDVMAGYHTVVFAKTFTVPPQVYPVWADGATAAVAVVVGSVTTTGFAFKLVSTVDGTTLVEGDATWAAVGF